MVRTRVIKLTVLGLVLLAVALGFIFGLYGLGGTEIQAQEDCTELDTIGPETTDQSLGPFDIDGNTVRVSGNAEPIDPNGQVLFDIDLLDEEGLLSGAGASIDEEGPFEENILVREPGTYSLRIITFSDVEYTVTASECGSSPPGGPADNKGKTTPKTSPAPPKTSPPSPTPKTSPPAPKTPTPAPPLMKAGGSVTGPVPPMRGGNCPPEFPNLQDGACY